MAFKALVPDLEGYSKKAVNQALEQGGNMKKGYNMNVNSNQHTHNSTQHELVNANDRQPGQPLHNAIVDPEYNYERLGSGIRLPLHGNA